MPRRRTAFPSLPCRRRKDGERMNDAVCLSVMMAAYVACASTPPNAPSERETTSAPETLQAPAEEVRQSAQPFKHESDTEYENGLASLMSWATALGASRVTSAYRVGYMAGLYEARDYQAFSDGEIRGMACHTGFAVVKEYFPEYSAPFSEAEVARIHEVCENKIPEARPGGAGFSKWRLKVAQWATESSQDPREVKALITVYNVGYNMGFAHAWEAVDHETHVEKITEERCNGVVQKMQPPTPSPAQLVAASSKCREDARVAKEEYGHRLKCLLANKEMSGELSGQATKVGCDHK
jgi:hypothetical protein